VSELFSKAVGITAPEVPELALKLDDESLLRLCGDRLPEFCVLPGR
jgi:hypothetical protein